MSEYSIEKELILKTVNESVETTEPVLVLGVDGKVKKVPKSSFTGGGATFITKTKTEIDELISTNGLIPGTLYEITGVHQDLYDDGTILGKKLQWVGISTNGSGYVDGEYLNVPLIGGSGSGATADIIVVENIVDSVQLVNSGTGYEFGDVLTVNNSNLGGSGNGYTYITNGDNFNNITLGTTIYLQALATNILSKAGYGKFYNPKYNSELTSYGIWNNRGTWETVQNNSSIFGITGNNPNYGICIDLDGNIYTANVDSNNVSKITPDGISTILGTTGSFPSDICIDSDNNIYTVNYGSNNVSKITPDGTSTIFGTTGTNPSGICIDLDNNIYTSNTGSNNVSKITPDGTSTIFGTTDNNPAHIVIDVDGNIYTSNNGSNNVSKITPDGTSTILGITGNSPNGICVDSDGNVYVANSYSHNISKITPDGTSTILSTVSGNPADIIIDADNIIYVTDVISNNVSKIMPDGTSTIFGTTGVNPYGICFDIDGNIYTANGASNNVSKIIYMIPFEVSENITSNNGATGTLIGDLNNNKFTNISGDWTTSTSITGDSSGATANIQYINVMSTNISDKTIWGGYSWTNVNGNIGETQGLLSLNSEWVKNQYSEIDYNVVYDLIEYDYVNDWISRRNEIEFGNDVICSKKDYDILESNYYPISVFQFGNGFTYNSGFGISNVKVYQSYFENINFIGESLMNILMENFSSQSDIQFLTNSCYQRNLKFNNASQYNIQFIGQNSRQTSLTFAPNSSQENIILNSESYQNNIIFNTNSSQYDITLTNSYQEDLTFNNLGSQGNIEFKGNNIQIQMQISGGQSNIVFNLNAMQQGIIFEINSWQDNIIFEQGARQQGIVFKQNSKHSGSTIPEYSNWKNIIFDQSVHVEDIIYPTTDINTIINNTDMTKTIYTRPDGTPKLRYFNNDDTLVIADITD